MLFLCYEKSKQHPNGVCNKGRKLTATSKDGKRKSFHIHSCNICQAECFTSANVNGMVRRASLETDALSAAKLAGTCTCTL
jgi:hypothetical protein